MGESSLTSFCLLFGFSRRAPSSGEAEEEAPHAGASTAGGCPGKGHLGLLQHPQWALLVWAADLPLLLPLPSPVSHPQSEPSVLSRGGFWAPDSETSCLGRKPGLSLWSWPLRGSEQGGTNFGMGRSCVSRPWSLKMCVSFQAQTLSSWTSVKFIHDSEPQFPHL